MLMKRDSSAGFTENKTENKTEVHVCLSEQIKI